MPRFRRLKFIPRKWQLQFLNTAEGHLSATRECNRTFITTVHWQKIYNGQRRKEKPFLNQMHCFQTNTHFFFELAVGWGKMLHCMVRNKNWITWWAWRTDTQKCTSRPGSIQCKKTWFRASFASSAGKKNNWFFFSVRTFYSLKRRGDFLAMQFSPVPKVLYSRSARE